MLESSRLLEGFMSEEPTPDDLILGRLHPERAVTKKQVEKSLLKVLPSKKQVDNLINFTNLAELGLMIKAMGTHSTSVGVIFYAAHKMQESIERCEKLMEVITDAELKVRLEERISYLTTELGKQGQGMAKTEDADKAGQTINRPVVNVFPANAEIKALSIVSPPKDAIES
jgi:hypothetical protein